jgi:CheY-like chemotaxis protein
MEHRHSSKKPDWNTSPKRASLAVYDAIPNGKQLSYEAFVYASCGESVFSSDEDSDEGIYFLTEAEETNEKKGQIRPWKILIADDDANVHETTVLALTGVEIHGKSLEFLHAFSAREARDVAIENPDTALILLDVVMETVDAGLKLVNVLREELARKDLRIVLRTGQPGYAKENMMDNYAIDGYATKSKLTRSILISMLSDILTIDKSHEELPN